MQAYEYRHRVGFEETNLVGSVYYVNHLRWQGRCRELFLNDHAPGVLKQIENGLYLATVHCSCDFFRELKAFDEVIIRMRLGSLVQNRMSLEFEYSVIGADGREELVARGEQKIAFMMGRDANMQPAPIPDELRLALRAYASTTGGGD